MIVLGVVISIFALLILTALTVLFYLFIKKRHRDRKVLNEVGMISFAFVLCFLVRLSVAVTELSNSVDNGVSAGFYALYATFGGLSFEGVDTPSNAEGVLSALQQCFYYGSVVYAAMVSLLIISTGISYEFFSFVEMRAFHKKYDVLYLFTDVSEQGLALALDIERREQEQKRKYAIVFIGENLDAFDRKNETHRIIMHHGFYYWSYEKNLTEDIGKSLAKRFHLTSRGCKRRETSSTLYKAVHIFSLNTNVNADILDGDNSLIAFEDVKATLSDYFDKSADDANLFSFPTVINYYLIPTSVTYNRTEMELNYNYYKNKLRSCIKEFFKYKNIEEFVTVKNEKGEDVSVSRVDIAAKNFQFHVVNEAKLSSIEMIQRLKEGLILSEGKPLSKNGAQAYYSFLKPDKDNTFRVGVFGFGQVGQLAAEELFIESSWQDLKTFKPSRYIVDAYDVNMESVSAEFAYGHPMFLCKNCYGAQEPEPAESLIRWADKLNNSAVEEIIKASKGAMTAPQVIENMGLPIVALHDNSCADVGFMNATESSLNGVYDSGKLNFRAFIVCLGTDDLNIKTANILIADLKREILLSPENAQGGARVVFVNLKKSDSRAKVNWTEDDEKYFKGKLLFIPFGAMEDIWTYSVLIDDDKDSLYNYSYNAYCANSKVFLEGVTREVRGQWLDVDTFLKESNRSARSFGVNYKLNSLLGYNDDEYNCRLEHLRWDRFYMAQGWTYSSYPKAEKAFRRANKQHTCLCPFEMLDEYTIKYDRINVSLGKESGAI